MTLWAEFLRRMMPGAGQPASTMADEAEQPAAPPAEAAKPPECRSHATGSEQRAG